MSTLQLCLRAPVRYFLAAAVSLFISANVPAVEPGEQRVFGSGLSGTQMYNAADETVVDGLTFRERTDITAFFITFNPFIGIAAFHTVLHGVGQSIADILSVDCSPIPDPATRVAVDTDEVPGDDMYCKYKSEAVNREVFGIGLSFNDGFLFVGAAGADLFDYQQYIGSVQVFKKERGQWQPFQELKPKPRPIDGVDEVVYPIGHFGGIGTELFGFRGVDSEGKWLAVGAANEDDFRGAAYTFNLQSDPADRKAPPSWVETQKLTRGSIPIDPNVPDGQKATRDTGAGWGQFPKFHGDWLFIGNYHSDLVGIAELANYDPRLASVPFTPEAGALHVFRRDPQAASEEDEWKFHQIIVSPRQFDVANETHDGPKFCEGFGSPIAPARIRGNDYIVIGAGYGNCAFPGTEGRHGSAYVFKLNKATNMWEYTNQRLSITDNPDRSPICANNPLHVVARSVFTVDNNLVIDGTALAIGADGESNCIDPDGDGFDADGNPINTLFAPGVIYVYRLEQEQWSFDQAVQADGPLVEKAFFGDAVDMKDGVIAASYGHSSESLSFFSDFDTNEGAVILFRLGRNGQWEEHRRILGEEPGDTLGASASVKLGNEEVATGQGFRGFSLGNFRSHPDRTETVRIIPFDVDNNGN